MNTGKWKQRCRNTSLITLNNNQMMSILSMILGSVLFYYLVILVVLPAYCSTALGDFNSEDEVEPGDQFCVLFSVKPTLDIKTYNHLLFLNPNAHINPDTSVLLVLYRHFVLCPRNIV